jgi:hypothetical protein
VRIICRINIMNSVVRLFPVSYLPLKAERHLNYILKFSCYLMNHDFYNYKINWLLMFEKLIAVYFVSDTKPIIRQNAKLFFFPWRYSSNPALASTFKVSQ